VSKRRSIEGKRLGELAAAVGVSCEGPSSRVVVHGVCEDSRRVRSGDLFVAIPGTHRDGVSFAREAVRRGAVAVVGQVPVDADVPNLLVDDARRALAALAAAFFDHPTRDLHTIGVTGTNGKTTVCHWAAHLLGSERSELLSTVTNADSFEPGLGELTTPPAPIVQRVAREALDAGASNLIVEASSIGLAQWRLDDVEFDVCAFTNLSRDHLDLHGNLADYTAAKSRLFASLDRSGCAVLNADDPSADAVLGDCTAQVLRVSRCGAGDLVAREVIEEGGRTRFRMISGGASHDVSLPVIGAHNVENALVAAGIAVASGLRLADVAGRLSSIPNVPGRQSVYRDGAGRTIVIDFAHNPDALERVLRALRERYKRLVAVFGCPGESDRGKRAMMGEVAGRLTDLTILTSDNPKHEAPDSIAEEIAAGLRRVGGRSEIVLDREEAIGRAVDGANTRDCVLVAGKGHERVQLVGDDRLPYSDAAVVESLGFAPVKRGVVD